MRPLASAAMVMGAMMMIVLALLACAPLPSVGLQWDRPLSLPPTIAWHSAVAMDIGAVQIRSNRDNRIRPQAWANFTLQGHLIVGQSEGGSGAQDTWTGGRRGPPPPRRTLPRRRLPLTRAAVRVL